MHNEVYTVNDLLNEAASALDARDDVRMEKLINISSGWLQQHDEADAQRRMLTTMLDAIYGLQELDDDE